MKHFSKLKRSSLSIFLSLAIVLTLVPTNMVDVHAADPVCGSYSATAQQIGGGYSGWITGMDYNYWDQAAGAIRIQGYNPTKSMSFGTIVNFAEGSKPEIIAKKTGKTISAIVLSGEGKSGTLNSGTNYSTSPYNNGGWKFYKIQTATDVYARVTVGGQKFRLEKIEVQYHGGTITKVNGQNATCAADGYKEYWKCSACGKVWGQANANGTVYADEDTWKTGDGKIAKSGHSLGYFAEQDSTCTEDGWNAYYKCEICEKVYTNENGTGTEYDDEATWKSSTVGKKAALGHNFQYSALNNTIFATCQNDNLHKAELLLDAEDATYTGSAIKNATVTSWSPDTYNTLLVTAPASTSIVYEAASGSALTNGDPINAGNYVAKVSITKDTDTYTAQKAFKIDRRHIDQTTIASTYNNSVTPPVYDGTTTFKQTITITDNASGTTKTLTKDVDYQLSDTLSSLLPGEFTATVTGIGNYTGTAEIEWEVKPAEFTLGGGEGQIGTVTVTPYSGTYDGQEHSINVNAPADATVTYSTSETGTYTDTNPTFKDAGDHKVYFKVDKTGYSTLSGNSDVIITHKIVDVSWSDAEDNIFTYDSQLKAPTATITNKVTVNGVADDVSVVLDAQDGAKTNARPLSPYTAIAEGLAGTDAKNYKLPITKPSCEFTINKAKVDIPQPLQTTYTYNRKEQALLSTSTLYTITNNTRTNAGSQEVAVELNDVNNYEWNTTDVSEKIAEQLYTFTIERRDISDEARVVIPTTRFFIEDDDETPGFTVELQVFDKIDNDDKELVKGTDKEYSVAGDTQVNPGTFDLYITFNGNYTGSILKHWSIYEDKRHELPVELPDDGNTYDGEVILIGAGDEEVPEFELSNPLDLLTPEEKDLLKTTGHNSNEKYVIEIILSLNTNKKEDLDEESLAAIEEKLNNPTGEHYYDISIRKVIKKYVDSSLHQTETHYATSTDSPIELKIHVPDEVPSLKGGYSRKYSMIRSHKNADDTYTADVLEVTYIRPDEDHPNGAVVFKSDKFSDYALTYKDSLIPKHNNGSDATSTYIAPNTSVR